LEAGSAGIALTGGLRGAPRGGGPRGGASGREGRRSASLGGLSERDRSLEPFFVVSQPSSLNTEKRKRKENKGNHQTRVGKGRIFVKEKKADREEEGSKKKK
jgi:hypothetical protein